MVAVLMAVSVAELVVLFVLPTVFVILYRNRSGGAWRDTSVGRHLMRSEMVLALTFLLTLANALAAVIWPTWSTLVVTVFGYDVPLIVAALVVQVAVFAAIIVERANQIRLLLHGNGHTERPAQ